MLHFQLYSAQYTALQMKNSRRSTSAINPVATKDMDDLHAPTINYWLKSDGHYALLSSHHTALQTKNSEHLCNQSSQHKNMDNSHLQMCGSHASCYCELTAWVKCPAKRNGRQRRTVRLQYDACIVCIAVCQKACLGMKRHQTVKKSSLFP